MCTGRLKFLEPGESKCYGVRLTMIENDDQWQTILNQAK